MEEVILVNENDEQTGTMEKMEVHQKGLLHRAFSIFVFNKNGELLLQQRADKKYHSGGLWSNSCCGHPRPDESIETAAERRLFEEMGIKIKLQKRFNFIYKIAFDNGLTEHEVDHVFSGQCNENIFVNSNEVKDFCFKKMGDVQDSLRTHPAKYTEWFHIAFNKFIEQNCS